ncbi:hypothetical protein SK128_017337 [Halocaridina rubra]|uniref:Uncharacterized protein n=1 Tax=Halocaridina rubra TaxID=373956 RepID=A0AAN8X8W1_HALRR
MFEAGLENVALRAVKRKGFGQQGEGVTRHDLGGGGTSGVAPSAGSGAGPSSSTAPGTVDPTRGGTETRRDHSERLCSASLSQVSSMSSHSGPQSNTSANESIKDLPLIQVSSTGMFYSNEWAS